MLSVFQDDFPNESIWREVKDVTGDVETLGCDERNFGIVDLFGGDRCRRVHICWIGQLYSRLTHMTRFYSYRVGLEATAFISQVLGGMLELS